MIELLHRIGIELLLVGGLISDTNHERYFADGGALDLVRLLF